MTIDPKRLDIVFLSLLLLLLVGLPFCIQAYDRLQSQEKLPAEAVAFTLTGHTEQGWIKGEVKAMDIVSLALSEAKPVKPVLEVNKGDLVVLKLKSSDVVHGFSLKDFGVFITKGIQPGKTVRVSFTANKTGAFTFTCNAICGDNHNNMQGTLIVRG